jgi:hypothetical protein
MNYRYSPKTSGSSSIEGDKNRRKGTVIIVTLFLFLAFSTLALGLIFISQVFLQVGGHEKNSSRLDYCSENGIKEGFHHLAAAIGRAPSPAIISEERYIELKDDARGLGNILLEEAAGIHFPVEIKTQEESMIWQSRTDCRLEKLMERDGFFLTVCSLSVQAEGRLRGLPIRRPTSLETRAEVLAGHIPLSALPFLLNKTLSPEERQDFLEENDITLLPSSREILPPQVSFADAPLIPESAAPFLEKALDIEIFRPQDMTAAKLRSVLGLEESQDPVPEGVYLIRDDLGLAGVYVQGDVLEMVTAIEGSSQVISFRLEEGTWVLKYSPSESKTTFRSPQGEETFNLVPTGPIVISGEVLSLGGGIVEAGGEVFLVTDREVPSILPGVNITLVASGKISITSHLVQQGLSWQEGIPYVKSEQSQVVIFSTGRDLWTEAAIGGGIVTAAGAPEDLKVQASLTAAGEGFKVEGENKTLRVLGSIQTTAYSSSGNALSLTPWSPRFESDSASLPAPQATQPVVLIARFSAFEWKEY